MPLRLDRYLARALLACSLVVLAASVGTHAASAAPPGATNRGLDLWIHTPTAAAGGDELPINAIALGFPTATSVAPLAKTVIEATWDPESLVDPTKKTQAPAAPPETVRATTDDQGRATLMLRMPRGAPRTVTLLVSVKAGDRERVREIKIERTAAEQFDLFLSDARVVPGSEVVAWALWTSKDRSHPVPNAPVEFVLTQGGVVRFKYESRTDPAGASMARIPIPRDDEPNARWSLVARAGSAAAAEHAGMPSASVELLTREETPGKPTLWSTFDDGSVTAGGKATYRIRVRDASEEGMAGHTVFVWSGPKGTEAPKDETEFRKAARPLVTDGAGEIVGEVTAPSTIPLRGTEIKLEARTDLEGLPRATTSSVSVGQRRGYVTLSPEGGEIVPGLEQRLVLELAGDDGKPLVGSFVAKGDGLDATFKTNAHGEAEVTWKVPKGIGAQRQTGPCPGKVAAQVTLRASDEPGATRSFGGALTDGAGMALCVPVRRDGTILVRPSKLVVREGDTVPISIVGGDKRSASVVIEQATGAQASGEWAHDAGQAKDIKIPAGGAGLMSVHVATPKTGGPSEAASATVLLLPKRLPRISGKLSGGRAVPGGKVTIVAELGDENGKPMVGSVAAVVIDKFGGGSFGPLGAIDTRKSLCRAMQVDEERCDAALLGGAEEDAMRRAHLRQDVPLGPVVDPAANAKKDMDETFAAVVRSLEGAVFESSQAQETLPDVRRKEGGKYVFNPELMTLVTDAMADKPLTPGGEPVSLADLIAIDNQITYDNVARRVTRLKLFQVLETVRSSRMGLDPDEPLLDDPNVFLRKLTREQTVQDAGLLDPWGGVLSFYKGGAEYVPFVSFKRGWELRSPGPDGKMGTGDDVKSPFERVVKSGTPYARAMDEDVVVDARYDMLVADATVQSWSETLLRLTGTALGGRGEGIGLGNVGTIGHGSGTGSGQGFGSGHGRLGFGIAKGVAHVSAPMRTDANGRVTLEIPLGDTETTWRVALVGLPDDGRPAMSTVDVPVTVPLSSKVNAGASWTDGDRAEPIVQVRNRTNSDLDVTLDFSTRGALALEPGQAKKTVRVAKQGVASVTLSVRAKGAGAGSIEVRTSAAGAPADVLTHSIEVRPKGELNRIARATWVSEEHDFFPFLTRAPFVPVGNAELVLDRGDRAALEAALESLQPERSVSIDELADIASAAGELHRHFIALEGDGSRLAARAKDIGRTATAKLSARVDATHPLAFSWLGRAHLAGFVERGEDVAATPECPSDAVGSLSLYAPAFEAEPPPAGGGVRDCWTKLVARGTNALESSKSPGEIARAVLALAGRPHRAQELDTLKKKLIELVEPDEEGNVSLIGGATRSDRALIYAALLVSSDPTKLPAKRARLVRWLLVQRDARGSFGTAAATRGAIQALVRESSYQAGDKESAKIALDFGAGGKSEVVLARGERKRITVPANATAVVVSPAGVGIMARVERTFLRPYEVAPETGDTPLTLKVDWPTAPECTADQAKRNACVSELKRGRVANMRVTIGTSRASGKEDAIDVRVPLPPGVSLADTVASVRQVQGALFVRVEVHSEQSLTIPLRFGLAGDFTAREATAKLREYEADAAIARARPVLVKP